MTIKEAILQSLSDLQKVVNYNDVYHHMIEKGYYEFSPGAKTPASTVSALLGDFIRKGDTRVKRMKREGGTFSYYLTKYEDLIDVDELLQTGQRNDRKKEEKKSYKEKDLHTLLSTYLNTERVYCKTIFHEKSKNSKDSHQKWIHPDMVGIKFLKLQSNEGQLFLKTVNQGDTFKISSYEIKREINTDYELKKYFFQAVSNSSWANYGYLVAFDIGSNLNEEMERLNQSFGIGIIQLNSYPHYSKVLFQPKYREIDFKTLDKLCKINEDFKQFIKQTGKLLKASEDYVASTEKELEGFCDKYLKSNSEIEKFCKDKHIPIEIEEEIEER